MKTFFALVIFFLFFTAYSQSDIRPVEDLDAVGMKLDNMAKSLNSIQSDFHQEKYMDFLDVTLISKGKFWFQKENSLRWQYTEPYNYIVIVDDGVVKISDDGKNQEFQVKGNKIFEQVNNIIVASMKGDVIDNDDFEVKLFENDKFYLVKLKPLKKEILQVIHEMEMYFDKTSLQISKIKMNEPNDDYTLIRYTNHKINEPICESVFSL